MTREKYRAFFCGKFNDEGSFILNHFPMEGFFEQTAAPLAGFIDRFCIGAE
jgi:hypothetical protein